jgi:hypothetical protein
VRILALMWLVGLAACGGASAPPTPPPESADSVERYFPAALGTAWSYDVTTDDGAQSLIIARVVAREGDRVAISVSGSEPNQYELRRDGVFSSDTGTYALRWPLEVGRSWPSRAGGEAHIVETSKSVETNAGRFDDCVLVREARPSPPATIDTCFCPGVGVARLEVKLTLDEGSLRTVTSLRGFAAGEP